MLLWEQVNFTKNLYQLHDSKSRSQFLVVSSSFSQFSNYFSGNELVQYGMQACGASTSPRGPPRTRERAEHYGRRELSPGQQQQQQQSHQSEYDVVHHIFNG